jgi:hypothetical protein
MRALQELVEQPEFVHHLEGGGVDRVATEVAQEVPVLLQDHDIHAVAARRRGRRRCPRYIGYRVRSVFGHKTFRDAA